MQRAVARLSDQQSDGTASSSAVVRRPYPGFISAGAVISRERAVSRRLGVRGWTTTVGALAFGAAIARILVAQSHTAARYWPDEYVYAAISRSLAHGHLQVRDQPAAFYAILQPIFAAPIWRFFPAHEAYRLIQVENAVFASLVVVPLWFLGRELKLPRLTLCLCCVYALLVPTLVMIPVTISDFIAYPLAISAVAVAVRSLNEPTRSRQIAFLCFAALATLARIQYFVVVPAYLAAAVMLDRRRAHREHPWVFGALIPAFCGAVLAVTGYYAVGASTFRPSMLTWMALQCFLLSLTAGVAIVPGAVAALLRPNGRVERAFSAFTVVFVLLVFVEASTPAAAEGRYKERYLLAIVPLLALAFGLYMKNRPHRLIVAAVGAALVISSLWLPISGYTFNAPFYDSETLNVAWLLQRHVDATTSSLLIVLFIAVAVAIAIGGAWRTRIVVAALPLSIAWMLCITIFATHIDIVLNKPMPDPAWIDEATGGAPVTAIATPASPRIELLKRLYWNASINREIVLDRAYPTDTYAGTRFKPGANGVLPGVHGYFLFDANGTQATFAGATIKARRDNYVLLDGQYPRLRVLVENQLSTGWLSPYTRLRAWPSNPRGNGSPVARFTLTLPPAGSRRVHMQVGTQSVGMTTVGTQTFVVDSGSRVTLTCRSPKWPLDLLLVSNDVIPDSVGRPVTAGLIGLTVKEGPVAHASGCSATR
jgi:hypothetical protein